MTPNYPGGCSVSTPESAITCKSETVSIKKGPQTEAVKPLRLEKRRDSSHQSFHHFLC